MKRLLYIAPFFSIPATDGGSQRATNLLLQLALGCDVTLLTYQQEVTGLADWCRKYGVELAWLPKPISRQERSMIGRICSRYPPGFVTYHSDAIAQMVDKLQQHVNYDMLYFATQLVGQTLLKKRWDTYTILDLYDIYAPIAHEKACEVSRIQPYHWLFRLEAWRVARYEREIIGQADQLLVTSDQDRQVVRQIYRNVDITVIPNGVHQPSSQVVMRQQSLLLVGNFSYAPNIDGFQWFHEHVWPQVYASQPDVRLDVVGKGSKELSFISGDDEAIKLLGIVPSLDTHYQRAGCVIVPILSGGGTRLKLLEAMAWGVPTVTTTKGAEGVAHEGSVWVADSAEKFAQYIQTCLKGTLAVDERASRARQIIADHYTWSMIGCQLREALQI